MCTKCDGDFFEIRYDGKCSCLGGVSHEYDEDSNTCKCADNYYLTTFGCATCKDDRAFTDKCS
jgi:hypothetical protein